MSNQICLYTLRSEDMLSSICDREHSDDCFVALQAIDSLPLLWPLLFRQSDLRTLVIFEDDSETHSVLAAKKREAFGNLSTAVDALCDLHGADFSPHARNFKRYINACPGGWIALPGIAEWVTGDSALRSLLEFLDNPSQRDVVEFLKTFRGWQQFSDPPLRAEYRRETLKALNGKSFDSERTTAYDWIFGFTQVDEDERDGLLECPWGLTSSDISRIQA